MKPGITVRDYRDGDLPGISELQLDVEPEMRCPPSEWADLWRWMYRDTPFPRFKVVVAESEGGSIVGHEGIMPFDLSIEGRTAAAGITCNLIVAERYRQTLLFPRLVTALCKGYPEAGFDLGYGPVRPKMLKSMIALGYRDLGPLAVYVRPYAFPKIAARYIKSRLAVKGLYPLLRLAQLIGNCLRPADASIAKIRSIDGFDDRSRAFFGRSPGGAAIHAVRSPEILNWRYFKGPHRTYRVYEASNGDSFVGYIALRRMSMLAFDTLAIVDIVYPMDRPAVGRALLAQAHRDAVTLGVEFVACLTAPRSPLVHILRREGFLRAPEGFNMIVHEPKDRTRRIATNALNDWYVTWFDHDYV